MKFRMILNKNILIFNDLSEKKFFLWDSFLYIYRAKIPGTNRCFLISPNSQTRANSRKIRASFTRVKRQETKRRGKHGSKPERVNLHAGKSVTDTPITRECKRIDKEQLRHSCAHTQSASPF
jgi:hypothetical protein